MKKTLIMILTVSIGISFLFAGTYSGGSGTEADPYQIASLADLSELCQDSTDWDKAFIQTADIDASATQYWDDSDDNSDGDLYNDANDANINGNNEGFSPIGNSSIYFSSSYDGQNHIITGLKIDRPSQTSVGLFGYVRGDQDAHGTVKNIGLENADISGDSETAILVGQAGYFCTIDNCYAKGTVTGSCNTGGLAGWLLYGTINTCFADVNIEGTGCTGGLVGNIQGSEVLNSYSLGSVIKNVDHPSYITWLGGFTGNIFSSSTVTNCYSTDSVGTTNYTGGFVATEDGSTVTGCFWDTETSGMAASDAGTGETTANMKIEATYTSAGWDFSGESVNGNDDIWSISSTENSGYPYLTNNQGSDIPLPITLASFTAKAKNGAVELAWKTETETDNARFIIYRNGEAIASIEGAGTSTEPHSYTYTDNSVVPGVLYTYVLADLSYGNVETTYDDQAVSLTIMNDILEADFVMNAAYPNPFNPSTTINYHMPASGRITASIFDMNGVLIEQLINGFTSAGDHELNWNASNNPSGVYILKMESLGFARSQKIVLMK